jgi:3-oxoacyl-[acyl-carrier protein] reductase
VGTLRLTRLFLRTLLARNTAGRIINISSIIGSRGYTGLAAYAASKAGLDGATRALAREVGRRGITVNSVAPGYLETEMSASLEGGQRSQIVRRTPLGRLGTVSDVTPVVRFLLSDEAGYITGQTILIDGGITC